MEINVIIIHNGDYALNIVDGVNKNGNEISYSILNFLKKYNLNFCEYHDYLNSEFTVKWISFTPYFLNLEDAEKAAEYLESLIVMQKLMGNEK